MSSLCVRIFPPIYPTSRRVSSDVLFPEMRSSVPATDVVQPGRIEWGAQVRQRPRAPAALDTLGRMLGKYGMSWTLARFVGYRCEVVQSGSSACLGK